MNYFAANLKPKSFAENVHVALYNVAAFTPTWLLLIYTHISNIIHHMISAHARDPDIVFIVFIKSQTNEVGTVDPVRVVPRQLHILAIKTRC